MKEVLDQYGVYLVNLDPTTGSEIRKTRPCLVISPNEMNHNINTVIIAPLTTQSHTYPTRIPITFMSKNGWIVLDQIRTVDKRRCVKYLGTIEVKSIRQVKQVLKEMLID